MTTPERFTPGPWERRDTQDYAEILADGHSIAMVAREGDADLIAAAPELYAVCVKQVEWLERLADHAEQQATDCDFVTLKKAYVADAKNYRATAAHIKRALARARGETA